MSEPAYSRSSSPSLTAQVVLRRRSVVADRPIRMAQRAMLAARASALTAPVTTLGPCVYCGRNSRDMACTAHRDLLILDVGEARG